MERCERGKFEHSIIVVVMLIFPLKHEIKEKKIVKNANIAVPNLKEQIT